MVTAIKEKAIEVRLTDAVGRWERRVALPSEAPLGAVLESLLPQLDLPLNQAYSVVNDRSQTYLRESDLVEEVVEPGDQLRLLPHVTAGI
jgi:hypothetical protein